MSLKDAPLVCIHKLAAVIGIQCILVAVQQLIHLLCSTYSRLELHLHLFKMLFESIHKIKHTLSFLCELDYLNVLTLDLGVCDPTDKTVVALDAHKLVLWGQTWQQCELSLQCRTRWLNKNLELLRLNQVGTS